MAFSAVALIHSIQTICLNILSIFLAFFDILDVRMNRHFSSLYILELPIAETIQTYGRLTTALMCSLAELVACVQFAYTNRLQGPRKHMLPVVRRRAWAVIHILAIYLIRHGAIILGPTLLRAASTNTNRYGTGLMAQVYAYILSNCTYGANFCCAAFSKFGVWVSRRLRSLLDVLPRYARRSPLVRLFYAPLSACFALSLCFISIPLAFLIPYTVEFDAPTESTVDTEGSARASLSLSQSILQAPVITLTDQSTLTASALAAVVLQDHPTDICITTLPDPTTDSVKSPMPVQLCNDVIPTSVVEAPAIDLPAFIPSNPDILATATQVEKSATDDATQIMSTGIQVGAPELVMTPQDKETLAFMVHRLRTWDASDAKGNASAGAPVTCTTAPAQPRPLAPRPLNMDGAETAMVEVSIRIPVPAAHPRRTENDPVGMSVRAENNPWVPAPVTAETGEVPGVPVPVRASRPRPTIRTHWIPAGGRISTPRPSRRYGLNGLYTQQLGRAATTLPR